MQNLFSLETLNSIRTSKWINSQAQEIKTKQEKDLEWLMVLYEARADVIRQRVHLPNSGKCIHLRLRIVSLIVKASKLVFVTDFCLFVTARFLDKGRCFGFFANFRLSPV